MYRVMVDDNFDYMNEEERFELGSFASAEEAIAACRATVDRDLARHFKPGMPAAELYDWYVSFGSDPFIVASAGEPATTFSAWTYAKARAAALCSAAAR